MKALLLPPFGRPCEGFAQAFRILAAPSGFVPGGGRDGRRSSLSSGGGVEGPDCVSSALSRVSPVKLEDCCVISIFLVVLCTLYPPPTKYMQLSSFGVVPCSKNKGLLAPP